LLKQAKNGMQGKLISPERNKRAMVYSKFEIGHVQGQKKKGGGEKVWLTQFSKSSQSPRNSPGRDTEKSQQLHASPTKLRPKTDKPPAASKLQGV